MPSTFVKHHTQALFSYSLSIPEQLFGAEIRNIRSPTHAEEALRTLLSNLKAPPSPSLLRESIQTYAALCESPDVVSVDDQSQEERVLREAVLGKLVVGIYAEALDTYLFEAIEAEDEAEWWADIERSRWRAAIYLLETLPIRLSTLAHTILHALQSHNLPIRPSSFMPSTLRRLFLPTSILRPNTIMISLFPHLHTQLHIFYPSLPSQASDPKHSATQAPELISRVHIFYREAVSSISAWSRSIFRFFVIPIELARQECEYKKRELTKLRDERAEVLGILTQKRSLLYLALRAEPSLQHLNSSTGVKRLSSFVDELHQLIQVEAKSTSMSPNASTSTDIFVAIRNFTDNGLRLHSKFHSDYLVVNRLHRPSALTQLWPRLLLLPPITLYIVHVIIASRASLAEFADEIREVVVGFVRDWLFEPLKGVVNTVRAGGQEGMLVNKEGVAADIESLTRMSLSLAQDKLNYSSEQLAVLSEQIRAGDLTPVLQIYEEDIRTPIKSAVSGTLLRSVFVQIQKAKVDIDQALSGIDKLLKSQELTFAFVGVAPACAIVYVLGGYIQRLWSSESGRGKYGGKKRRLDVWLAMRRIERLLISQPQRPTRLSEHHNDASSIPPLTAGLLLLSVTHLRSYAETCLPLRSRLREGFLEDVEDMEDPGLGKTEKLRVIDRMWKSWGDVLDWRKIGGQRK